MLETTLFNPVKDYLQAQGYTVNAEVKHCDVTATRENELIIIELKTSANMQLLIQATDRQQVADGVYIAVPLPEKNNKHWRGIQRVVRQLQLGMLTVSFSPPAPSVIKLFDPISLKKKSGNKRQGIIKEINARQTEYNIGGSTNVKLMTSYRQTAILIATCLEKLGDCSPKRLRALGTGERTAGILQNNHYAWFNRVARGVYAITDKGRREIRTFSELHTKSESFIRQQLNFDD